MNCADCGKPLGGTETICETCAAEADLMRQTREEQIAVDVHHDAGLIGIRGWLAFFCVSIGILTPTRMLEELRFLSREFEQESDSSFGMILFGSMIALTLLIAASSIVVAISVALRKAWAPRAAKIYLLSIP